MFVVRRTLFPNFSRLTSTKLLFCRNGDIHRSVVTGQRLHQDTRSQVEPLTQCVQEGGIRVVTLNNLKKRNALSLAMLDSLKDALTRDIDGQVLMVIVLRSSGPVFSAGHDLKELRSEQGAAYHEKVFERCSEVMKLVQDVPVPVIAEVRGLATAAGCQLVASCDIAVAAENAKFATPGVNIGLFCHTPGIAVARSVPKKTALLMLFTGQPISAHDALVHGLISKVVPEVSLEEETMAIAKKIASNSLPVTSIGKSFFYQQLAMNRDDAYRCGEEMMLRNLRISDSQEGIDAFLKKRQPQWSHDDGSADR